MSAPSTALITAGYGCRYYGKSHAALKSMGVLLEQLGNECAVVFDCFSPCKMEQLGHVPDEKRCPRSLRYHQDHKPAEKGVQW
jgi:hypothetical protein